MNKVVFFNHWHNGDVHVTRGIVKLIIKKVNKIDPNIKFTYSHRNDPSLLSDIPNLDYDGNLLNNINCKEGLIVLEDTVYINTWYDQQNQKFARQYGILTIDALYAALNNACVKLWGFSLQEITNNPEDFFPSIDYSKFEISSIKTWLANNTGVKILIENGNAMSGQAQNFDMMPIIIKLAETHTDKTFILSKKEDLVLPNNIVYTHDIIKKQGTDLNEISFLSTHCDLIIGRSSGVFTFSIVGENIFKRQIKIISFSHLMSKQNKFWIGSLFHDLINYSSTIFATSESNPDKVLDLINRNL